MAPLLISVTIFPKYFCVRALPLIQIRGIMNPSTAQTLLHNKENEMATLSATESQSRDMIDLDAKVDVDQAGWTYRQAIRNVFWVQYHCSLTAARIAEIAAVLMNEKPSEFYTTEIQRALTKAVKSGLLRSRMYNGKRHYELNY